MYTCAWEVVRILFYSAFKKWIFTPCLRKLESDFLENIFNDLYVISLYIWRPSTQIRVKQRRLWGMPLAAKMHIWESICTDYFISCCIIITAGAAISLIMFSHHASQTINSKIFIVSGSWDIIVGIATGYQLDDWRVGVRVPVRARIFSSSCLPNRLRGAPRLAPSIQWLPGLFPRG
jgi:hypothetical protein